MTTHLHTRLHNKIEIFQHGLLLLIISQVHLFKLHLPLIGPIFAGLLSRLALKWSLLLQFSELYHPLDARHLRDHLGGLLHAVLQHTTEYERLGNGEADVTGERRRVHVARIDDDEAVRDEGNERDRNYVQPEAEGRRCGQDEEVGSRVRVLVRVEFTTDHLLCTGRADRQEA